MGRGRFLELTMIRSVMRNSCPVFASSYEPCVGAIVAVRLIAASSSVLATVTREEFEDICSAETAPRVVMHPEGLGRRTDREICAGAPSCQTGTIELCWIAH